MRANEFVQEGVNDPAIFKVVFVVGGPGSGKSYVSRELGLNSMGFVTVNSDVAFEYMMKKHDLDPKMPPEQKAKRDIVRSRAKEVTGLKSDLAIEGRLGIHIDGTGDDYSKVANLKRNFEQLGYDSFLVVVNTKLDVAKKRNQMRDRTVPDDIVTNSWYNVQDNIGRFAELFTRFSIIDNSGDIESTNAQINKVHTKLKQFANEPPTKPIAKKWIQDHKPQVNEKWSQKYKSSINCNNPKGFSQRAHCQGRKKKANEEYTKNGSYIIRAMTYEASYPGNLGAMEMYKFRQIASPKVWDLMKRLIAAGKQKEAWMLLQKVTGDKLHEAQMDEVGKFINSALKNAGYKFIGSGYDAQVWMKDEGTVVKILMPETQENEAIESFKTFYNFVKRHNDLPNLPKFKKVDGREVYTFSIKGKPFMQFGMEQLYPLKNDSLDEWVVWHMADYSAKQVDWEVAKKGMSEEQDEYAEDFTAQNSSKMNEYKVLYDTLRMLHKVGRKKGYGWDPHTENIMQRSDGTLVITDPWAV
jgi:dephospho-CoA kinase